MEMFIGLTIEEEDILSKILLENKKETEAQIREFKARKKRAQLFLKEIKSELDILEEMAGLADDPFRVIDEMELSSDEDDEVDRFIAVIKRALKALRKSTPADIEKAGMLDSPLYIITKCYMKDEDYNKKSMMENIFSLGHGCENEPNLSIKEKIRTLTKRLKSASIWIIKDTPSTVAASQAIKEKSSVPNLTIIVHRDDPQSYIPKITIKEILNNAESEMKIKLRCLDTFYNTNKRKEDDARRLSSCTENEKCILLEFFGKLNIKSILKIPSSTYCIGLPIQSECDMKLVSRIRKWDRLEVLEVAVNVNLPPCVLKPLPDVKKLCVHFYGLDDDMLEKIRPILEKLLAGRTLHRLIFAACDFSFSTKTEELSLLLADLPLDGIIFDPIHRLHHHTKKTFRNRLLVSMRNSSGEPLGIEFDMRNFVRR